ncbi:7,8-dihydro-8-oxoguanine triphosphatase [Frankliniella fusca]|uniref:Oxidized purine nucleoside triphosphate hydrolase n=1 Tax=Frankliniella fusca TaxID=407009 RepID=A0AAE1L7S2_9NEOP|nr:7,8-dihydro-8-oxoguanine triphosphatase [Frankliniella fusca]
MQNWLEQEISVKSFDLSEKVIMTTRKILTLTLVRNVADEILLGLKKRGFGEGKWNGFGGKVEPGETIPQAAARELTEECGLQAHYLTKVGLLDFEFVNDPVILEVHVFETRQYSGTVIETEEMCPKWYKIEDIPFQNMWLDDAVWFPRYLKGGPQFYGYFLYKGFDTILKQELKSTDLSPATTVFERAVSHQNGGKESCSSFRKIIKSSMALENAAEHVAITPQ